MERQNETPQGLLRKPDEKIIEALTHLEDNQDFKVILDWFMSSASDVDRILRGGEPDTRLVRAQGASGVLLAFCSYASNPRETMATMKRHKAGIVFPGERTPSYPSMPTIAQDASL